MNSVARFLFTLWPFPGHLHPNVAIAHALGARGHVSAFYTGGSVQSSLEGEGFECFPFRHVNESTVSETVLTLDALSLDWRRARDRKRLLIDWLLGTVEAQLEDLRAIVKAWRTDVLVCDPAMWGPLLVLQETEDIPLAVMSYVAACMLPGPDGPILGVPLPRSRSTLGRIGRRALRAIADLAARDVRRRAGQLRRQHGLPPMRTSVTAFAGTMPLYVVPSTPMYDRQRRDLPPSVQYVGPCQWDKPGKAPAPVWLRELPRDASLVYVTEGTMHAKEPFLLRAALEGLASLPVRVVATTGRHRSPRDLNIGAVPANARVEAWVPHSDILGRADVVVTTGGTGTVLAALSAGTPLVIVPTAWDQPENAWRVVEAGAGLRIDPRTCTPDKVRDAVQRVLTDSSFRSQAQRLAKNFAQFGGATQAARLLEDLATLRARSWSPERQAVADRPPTYGPGRTPDRGVQFEKAEV